MNAINILATTLMPPRASFEGPKSIIDSAIDSLRQGPNQYARSQGDPLLCKALKSSTKNKYDEDKEITVFAGATEAIFCSLLSLIDLQDEVIVFEPHYDSYLPSIAAAGGVGKIVTLRRVGNRFTFDPDELKRAFSKKTKGIVLNTPHNPTGTVYNKAELELIAKLCMDHDAFVLSDEVYEHIVFDKSHLSISSLPHMRDKTLVVSSAGKTFSFTGFKIGWVFAHSQWTDPIRVAKQYTTFSTVTPLQKAIAHALTGVPPQYYMDLANSYHSKRDKLADGLKSAGFDVVVPDGTYFLTADVTNMMKKCGIFRDVEFCKYLIEHVGVAAIPNSAFYSREEEHRYVRFAFCKTNEVLDEALMRIKQKFG